MRHCKSIQPNNPKPDAMYDDYVNIYIEGDAHSITPGTT